MRQKVVNVILGIGLVVLSVFLGFLFYNAESAIKTSNVSVGEAVGTTFSIIFFVVFFAIIAVVSVIGIVFSFLNMKGDNSSSKIWSGTIGVGYLFVFVLSIFKLIYL